MFNLEFLGVSPSKNMNFGKIRSETPVTRISPTMDVISGFGKKIWKHTQNSLKPMGHGKNNYWT
jgi:hypothetical protein